MPRITLLLALTLALAACAPAAPVATPTAPMPAASAVALGDGVTPDLEAVRAEQARRRASLESAPYVLLRPGLDGRLDAAQRAAAADARVQAAARSADGQRWLAEVMAVGAASAGDVPAAQATACPAGSCVKVQLYVYASNTTLTALVAGEQVLDVQSLSGGQPEIPRELAELATQIAARSPATAAALGVTPSEAMALDYASATKTSAVGTACERSHHLCASPVFTWGSQALWVIVDLTDMRVVGATSWTEQGRASQRRDLSEATLEDAALAPLCEEPRALERDGWSLSYLLTSSDGLELRDVRYQGRPVLGSAKLVDWHVSYPGSGGERVGFSDTVGCPVFSSAAIIPHDLPQVTALAGGGFALNMTFRSPNWPQPCNYQYRLEATFAPGGALTITPISEGRGCGVQGLYHPILRLALPPGSPLALAGGEAAGALTQEGSATWPAGSDRAFVAGDLRLAPAWGDADQAYVYWSAARPAEGEGDLPSIGTCCRVDIQQGPEAFVTPPEPLGDSPVVWWVPQIPNAERAKCWADMELRDGTLVPHIWPCGSGVSITHAAP